MPSEVGRIAFGQYISDLAPFYMGLVSAYLESLLQQSEFSLEDIQIFAEMMSVFSLRVVKPQKVEDITQPMPEDQIYTVDGFLELRGFMQMVRKQHSF